jgi:Starch binding domain
VYGSTEELGNWQETRAIQLTEVNTPLWEGDVTLPCTSCPFSYRCDRFCSPRSLALRASAVARRIQHIVLHPSTSAGLTHRINACPNVFLLAQLRRQRGWGSRPALVRELTGRVLYMSLRAHV